VEESKALYENDASKYFDPSENQNGLMSIFDWNSIFENVIRIECAPGVGFEFVVKKKPEISSERYESSVRYGPVNLKEVISARACVRKSGEGFW